MRIINQQKIPLCYHHSRETVYSNIQLILTQIFQQQEITSSKSPQCMPQVKFSNFKGSSWTVIKMLSQTFNPTYHTFREGPKALI